MFSSCLMCVLKPPSRISTLFPYTTLFRSLRGDIEPFLRLYNLSKAAGMSARHVINLLKDRKSTRLNSSHLVISYAVFCLHKKYDHNSNRQSSRSNSLSDNFVHKSAKSDRK